MKNLKLLLSAIFIQCVFISYAGIIHFPEKLGQWTLSEGPYIISIENLYDFAGNDYDTFFEYGFRKGNKVSYINPQNDIIEVSIYEFLTSTHALGLFSFFKEDIYLDKDIPCESLFISHYGSFQKGKYVVNIIGNAQSEKFERSVYEFAKHINNLLPTDCHKPDWFDFAAYDNNARNLDNYRLFFGQNVLSRYFNGDEILIPDFHEGVFFPVDEYSAFIFKCTNTDHAKYFMDKIKNTTAFNKNPTYKKWFSTITIGNHGNKFYKIKRSGGCVILLYLNDSQKTEKPSKAFRKAVSYKK